MPFPEDYISNWIKHPIVDGACSTCGLMAPSVTVKDGVAYEKHGRWVFGTPPKKSEDCTG